MIERLRAARANDGYAHWERRTNIPLLLLAVVFAAVLIAGLALPLSPAQQTAVDVVGAVIWALFVVDYAARLYLAPERWRFVRTHVLDLAAVVLPMFRSLRILRLLPVIGLLHIRAQRSLQARVSTYVVGATLALLAVAAVAMREAERGAPDANITTLGDALWWAITTVTTVGYGDRYPTTILGRSVAVSLMVLGIALIGVVTASVAAWFVDRLHSVKEAEERTEATLNDVLAELREVRARLEALDRQTSG